MNYHTKFNSFIVKALAACTIISALLFSTQSAGAATAMTAASLTAVTPLTVLTGGAGKTVLSLMFINSSTNTATVKFYDSTSNSTNYVQAAYTSYALVSTNWSSVFTNATGVVITNTFTGFSRVGTSNSASTNERPSILSFIVPASTTRTITDVAIQPALGLTAYSTQTGTLEVEYRVNP